MEHIYEIVFDGTKQNDYVRGRISGMIYILTRKPKVGFPWRSNEIHDLWYIRTVCSEDVFNEIIETINHVYPDVIVDTRQVS